MEIGSGSKEVLNLLLLLKLCLFISRCSSSIVHQGNIKWYHRWPSVNGACSQLYVGCFTPYFVLLLYYQILHKVGLNEGSVLPPTYVYPDQVKQLIRSVFPLGICNYPNPSHDRVSVDSVIEQCACFEIITVITIKKNQPHYYEINQAIVHQSSFRASF